MVYQAGIDLFLGSLLALIATFFAWLQFNSSGLAPLFQPILFALHWLFLCLSLLLFIIAMFHLLHVAELTGNSQDKDKP
jgi:quinol-cytochrome oxidoreductase complex cytochrome b subunit